MNVSATYKAPENPKGTVTLVMDEDTAKDIASGLSSAFIWDRDLRGPAAREVHRAIKKALGLEWV